MTVVDVVLAAAGRAHAGVSDHGREERRVPLVMTALLALSVVPALLISVTPTPLDRSLVELRDGQYRDRSSWIRLEGELRAAEPTSQAAYTYVLQDSADAALAVTVLAPGPLPTGHVDVTGRPLGGIRLPGTFDAFFADAPTEPARQDPWPLIGLPALLAVVLGLGARLGYPVVRRERVRGSRPAALGPDELVSARWSGWIGNDDIRPTEAASCSVAVRSVRDAVTVTLVEAAISRSFTMLRGSPRIAGRACRIGGCVPGLELHAHGADVILEFATTRDRDRVAASLD